MEQYQDIKEMLHKEKMERKEKRKKEDAERMKREMRGDYTGPKEQEQKTTPTLNK